MQFSIEFLHDLIDYFGEIGFSIQRIQTDCGSEFYAESLQEEMTAHFIKFRPNPPGKQHLNGKVERTQKTDQEEFYRTLPFSDKNLNIRRSLVDWIEFYNYKRPHSFLGGKTPYERFMEVKDDCPIVPEIAHNWYKSKEKIKTLSWEKFKKQKSEIAKFAEEKMSQMS
ncbi:MAG: transposase [Bdellovibrionaceae bacterium]|nr:transposase [Pseudobdellovibrionaceae bacterium]